MIREFTEAFEQFERKEISTDPIMFENLRYEFHPEVSGSKIYVFNDAYTGKTENFCELCFEVNKKNELLSVVIIPEVVTEDCLAWRKSWNSDEKRTFYYRYGFMDK